MTQSLSFPTSKLQSLRRDAPIHYPPPPPPAFDHVHCVGGMGAFHLHTYVTCRIRTQYIFFCLTGRICAWVFFRLVCGSWTDFFQEQDLAFLSEWLTENGLQKYKQLLTEAENLSPLEDIWSWTTFWPRRAGIWTSQFSIKSKCRGGVGEVECEWVLKFRTDRYRISATYSL